MHEMILRKEMIKNGLDIYSRILMWMEQQK